MWGELVAEVRALSPASAAVAIAVVGSAAYLAISVAWKLLAAVVGLIRRLLPLPAPKKQPSDESEISTGTTSTRRTEPQTKGVSMKALMKEASKGKPGQHHDAKHATSKLFITGLKGHTAEVTGLAWSPDGTQLATACDDRTVRLFNLSDPTAKNIPFKRKELRVGVQDVAFGDDDAHVAVQTKGLVSAAGLMMLDFRPKEPQEEWAVEGVHANKLPGLCLAGASTSKGGYGVLASCSTKTDLRVYSSAGRLLGSMDTGGLNNYMATISRDGRWVAAGTFTSDVKVYEVTFDRLGAFTGVKSAMSLKGHKSKVFCLDFSPDLTKAVTASGDGLLKVWNINVRYHMDEDPKVLLSTGLSLLPGKCYSRLAWGPDYIAAVCGTTLHFLDPRTGEVVERVEDAHDAAITSLEWSSSKLRGPQGVGSVLATGGLDGRVRLWAALQKLV
ncbi:Transducin beta 2 [Micractinium conductrix]|uniref:Transducin beta 2 n=1 Tax=Micractinium conductrix TaxID=554055 RepID=A0A2P6VP70_9CHLO|nr:Transducin beta 2 [Micractinium conductrix]|eukprot:PSC75857.1 Transducin beta 2 [Micractinium conductrix]